MPKTKRNQYKKVKSAVTVSTPKDINVEQESAKISSKIGFKPMKLAAALVELGELMYGLSLYEYQKAPAYRIIYSMLINDGAEVTLLYSRQSGKSETIAFCAITIGVFLPVLGKYIKELEHFSNGVKMGVIAPVAEQAETVYDRCMTRLKSDSVVSFMEDPDINTKLDYKARFVLSNGSFLHLQSGSKQSKIESQTYHIVFIDEAQDMNKEKVQKSVMPMLAATYGTIVRSGTVNNQKSEFYEKIKQNKNRDRKIIRNKKYKENHFEYPYKEVVRQKEQAYKKDGKLFHTFYKKSVERDKRTMGGKNSLNFKMAYRLIWNLDEGMFITEDNLENFVLNRRIAFKDILYRDTYQVAGLDVAKAKASTVLTIGKADFKPYDFDTHPKKEVAKFIELSGTNYAEQIEIIVENIIKYNVKCLFIDYTGVGAVLGDLLYYHLASVIEIYFYVFSTQSKSLMWKELELDIGNGLLQVPYSKNAENTVELRHFKEQFLNLTKRTYRDNLICQKSEGFLDDYCDSTGLMNLAGNHIFEEEQPAEVVKNKLFNTKAEQRKKASW